MKHVTIIDDLVTVGTDVTFIDIRHNGSNRSIVAESELQRFAFSSYDLSEQTTAASGDGEEEDEGEGEEENLIKKTGAWEKKEK